MKHDSPEIPVFLRFINMIINDAIVQLDEGLQVCLHVCLWLFSSFINVYFADWDFSLLNIFFDHVQHGNKHSNFSIHNKYM